MRPLLSGWLRLRPRAELSSSGMMCSRLCFHCTALQLAAGYRAVSRLPLRSHAGLSGSGMMCSRLRLHCAALQLAADYRAVKVRRVTCGGRCKRGAREGAAGEKKGCGRCGQGGCLEPCHGVLSICNELGSEAINAATACSRWIHRPRIHCGKCLPLLEQHRFQTGTNARMCSARRRQACAALARDSESLARPDTAHKTSPHDAQWLRCATHRPSGRFSPPGHPAGRALLQMPKPAQTP